MSKHIALRITGTITALTAFVVLTTAKAFAALEPGLGEGSGTAGPGGGPYPPPPETAFNWPLAIAVAVAVMAVIGLLGSVQHRRSVSSQQA
jgi:ribose/xylose/arabinose/galactoside ABC-type transport system permease subunit